MKTQRITHWLPFSLLGTMALVSCDDPVDPTDEIDPQDELPSVDNISEKPANFWGQRVTISGEVDEVFGERAFELEDDLDFMFEDKVLVLTKSPVRFGPDQLGDDDDVLVSGTIKRFVAAEIERELGWGLAPHLQVEDWDQKPVLVADSVNRIEKVGRWSENGERQGTTIGWAAIYTDPEPARLVGQPITLESVRVQDASGRGLLVGSHAFPVFVATERAGQFDAGTWVDLTGSLQAMPTKAEAMAKWDLDDEIADDIEDAVFFVEATKVEETKNLPHWVTSMVTYEEYGKKPEKHANQRVKGDAKVRKVISDRAFYLEHPGGKDVLAIVLEDLPRKEKVDIDEGERIVFTATSRTNEAAVTGTMQEKVKEAVSQAPGFLTLYWRDISTSDGS